VEYLHNEKACENEWESIYRESNSHLERLFALHYRLLGRLLVIADIAEKDLGRNGQSLPPSVRNEQ
jgi:hypothetical protein